MYNFQLSENYIIVERTIDEETRVFQLPKTKTVYSFHRKIYTITEGEIMQDKIEIDFRQVEAGEVTEGGRPFTPRTFEEFLRKNTGFNPASGGSEAVAPFNSFQFDISNLGANPTAGKANFNISDGEIFGIRINYTTKDNVSIMQYLTSVLVNKSLLINIPTNESPNSIMIVTAVIPNVLPNFCTVVGTITVGNVFPNNGTGTLTFIA